MPGTAAKKRNRLALQTGPTLWFPFDSEVWLLYNQHEGKQACHEAGGMAENVAAAADCLDCPGYRQRPVVIWSRLVGNHEG